MDQRYYNSIGGRFLTPDPGGIRTADPKNPGSWNRYAYAYGDPVNYYDPSGEFACNPDFCDNAPTDPALGPRPVIPPPPKPPVPPDFQDEWDNLSYDCQKGLTTAMPGSSIPAMILAVNRAVMQWNLLSSAGDAHGVDPAMLAAIGIRETGFKNIPQANGGLGRGIFQIDIGKNPSVTEAQAYNLTFAADWAANLLATNMATLAVKYPDLDPLYLLQATAASYNFGTKNISGNPATIDVGTTGGNYGSNVLDLMDCFH